MSIKNIMYAAVAVVLMALGIIVMQQGLAARHDLPYKQTYYQLQVVAYHQAIVTSKYRYALQNHQKIKPLELKNMKLFLDSMVNREEQIYKIIEQFPDRMAPLKQAATEIHEASREVRQHYLEGFVKVPEEETVMKKFNEVINQWGDIFYDCGIIYNIEHSRLTDTPILEYLI